MMEVHQDHTEDTRSFSSTNVPFYAVAALARIIRLGLTDGQGRSDWCAQPTGIDICLSDLLGAYIHSSSVSVRGPAASPVFRVPFGSISITVH